MAKTSTSPLVGLALLVAMTPPATAATQHHGKAARASPASSDHMFYNISEDPQSLQLLALSDSGEVNGKMMMDVEDVFRSPKLLMGSTWQIDCAGEQMAIVQTMRAEHGSPVDQTAVTPQPVSPRSSPKAWRIFRLACDGAGNLVERRMYHGSLTQIVARFWAQ